MKKRVDHFDLAQRSAATARKAGEAMESAGHVIAARTEMAALAYANPSVATGIEMNLMVSEKVVALSEAGATLYALALTTCRSPIELFALQGRLMSEFVTRGMAFGLGLNTLATRTGEQVMDPIHKTVTANHKRLKK